MKKQFLMQLAYISKGGQWWHMDKEKGGMYRGSLQLIAHIPNVNCTQFPG